MANLAGIFTGIGETANQLAGGYMAGRERKQREQYASEEAQRRRAPQAIGQPILGADGKFRVIRLDPQTSKMTVEEVPGMPALPGEYKGLHSDERTGDVYAIMLPPGGGQPTFNKVLSGADPAKLTQAANDLVAGIDNSKAQADAARQVKAQLDMGNPWGAYEAAYKALDDSRRSQEMTGRAEEREAAKQKARQEAAQNLLNTGLIQPGEAAMYVALGPGALTRLSTSTGVEWKLNELTGELIPVPIQRTTRTGITPAGGLRTGGAGSAQPRALGSPNIQVRPPAAAKAESAELTAKIEHIDRVLDQIPKPADAFVWNALDDNSKRSYMQARWKLENEKTAAQKRQKELLGPPLAPAGKVDLSKPRVQKVAVRDKNGKLFKLPADQVPAALRQGYTLAPDVPVE